MLLFISEVLLLICEVLLLIREALLLICELLLVKSEVLLSLLYYVFSRSCAVENRTSYPLPVTNREASGI